METPSDVQELLELLGNFKHPFLIDNWAYDKEIVKINARTINICFPFASHDLQTLFKDWLATQKNDNNSLLQAYEFNILDHIATLAITTKNKIIPHIKNIIAVASGKGGVGKSTTAANLALGLARQGAKVGILDADVYGPSIPMIMGTNGSVPYSSDGKRMDPIKAHGIVTSSVGYLIPANDAAIWRGPMASKVLEQLLNDTNWPDLDYMVIDMPPGTGDIQITMSQQIPVTGVVIVTTPQDLALADAIKGVNMFKKVHVPVTGIVENMSYHVCPNCGHIEHIFGNNGARNMAKEQNLMLLGQLPLDISVRNDTDKGNPTVIANPDSPIAKSYMNFAGLVASQLYWQGEVSLDKIDIKNL